MDDFKAPTSARAAGFLLFLCCFALSMLAGAGLLVLGQGLLAFAAMFIGAGLSSFLGIALTRRLCLKQLEAWRARQGERPFVIEDP